MTEFKVGDKVKVTLEGMVSYENNVDSYDVFVPDLESEIEYVPVESIEKLPDPPVMVEIPRGLAKVFTEFGGIAPAYDVKDLVRKALEVQNNE